MMVASDKASGPCSATASCRARRASPSGSMTCPVPSVTKALPRGIRSAATGHLKGQSPSAGSAQEIPEVTELSFDVRRGHLVTGERVHRDVLARG